MFEKTFCSSPWYHMRIYHSGEMQFCRWGSNQQSKKFIQDYSPVTWFQKDMAEVRMSLLNGETVENCHRCATMERHGKVSGREKQLLKIGCRTDNFEKSLLSSEWLDEFRKTIERDGVIDLVPVDWQIDLGNFCNSACIFCDPVSSSRIAAEYKKIGFINKMPPQSWSKDITNIERLIEVIKMSTQEMYIHFLGGETLITPAFQILIDKLLDNNLQGRITLGLTTNLTVWDDSLIDKLKKFNKINLGVSVETLDKLNDYIRFGSNIEIVKDHIYKWRDVSRKNGWLMQFRPTPTIFSVNRLVQLFEFCYDQDIAIESCNFLDEPAIFRPCVLPLSFRTKIIDDLNGWINSKISHKKERKIINIRNPYTIKSQVMEDAQSYVRYLTEQEDESFRLPELVRFIKKLEASRNNSILDYSPEYEELLRTAGY